MTFRVVLSKIWVASLFSGGDANDLEALEHTVCSKQEMETLFTSGRLSLRLSMNVLSGVLEGKENPGPYDIYQIQLHFRRLL